MLDINSWLAASTSLAIEISSPCVLSRFVVVGGDGHVFRAQNCVQIDTSLTFLYRTV
jgi:hypothetical protein